MRQATNAAEAFAGTLAVSIDDIRAGIRARDARNITYLLTPAAQSPKLAHNGGHVHVIAGVQYLLPATMGGRGNLCPAADSGCAGHPDTGNGACYVNAGRAAFTPGINVGRGKKVDFMADDPAAYAACLYGECLAIVAEAAGVDSGVPAIRLNGLSDIRWEARAIGQARNLMDALPQVRFYDYTRLPSRIAATQRADWPRNYDITFSLGADNDRVAQRAIDAGMKLAVVFRRPFTAASWHGVQAIDGQAHDFRFLENGPLIVTLPAKGPARRDITGWVRETDSTGLDLARTPAFIRR